MIRKASAADLPALAALFDAVHTQMEKGENYTGWQRGIYPTEETARAALNRDDLFVSEDEGRIVGTGIINQLQVDVYEGADWEYPADPDKVMVLHTLIIDPNARHKGYGREFIRYYEDYALQHGCPNLRFDTNEKNRYARALYQKLGYKEIGIRPTVFNGIPGVNLVLLEKHLALD